MMTLDLQTSHTQPAELFLQGATQAGHPERSAAQPKDPDGASTGANAEPLSLEPPFQLSPEPFLYLVSGLSMRSDVELPSAIGAARPAQGPEVTIAAGRVPEHLDGTAHGAARTGLDWEAAGERFLLRVAGTGRFLITGGREILYRTEPDYAAGDLPLYLLGTCLAVLLHQRGCLVLHASAVAVGGRAVLFCGPSGAGKSTVAALLCRHGYALLNDDTCRLLPSPAGFAVAADGRMLKLWENSIAHLALDAQRGPAVRVDSDKFYLPPPNSLPSAAGQPAAQPHPVREILLLESCPASEPPTLERLTPLAGMAALQHNSYRPALIRAMDLQTSCFAGYAALLQQAPVYRMRRPLDFAHAAETLQMLERHWQHACPHSPG